MKLLADSDSAHAPMSTTFLAAAAARSQDATSLPRAATIAHPVLYDAAQFPLLAAAESGDAAKVARLLDADASVNLRTVDGWSALIMAAKEGHSQIVTQLLMNDAAINPPTTEEEAADLGIPFLPPSHTALRGAAMNGRVEVVKMLLENEADPNQTSSRGLTPLMGAARGGYVSIVELLCTAGAMPLARNEFGETARDLAAAKGYSSIVDALQAHEATASLSGAAATPAGLSMGQAADLLAGYLESQGSSAAR